MKTTIVYNGIDISEHIKDVDSVIDRQLNEPPKPIGEQKWSIDIGGEFTIDVGLEYIKEWLSGVRSKRIDELTEDDELIILKAIGDEIWRRIAERKSKTKS